MESHVNKLLYKRCLELDEHSVDKYSSKLIHQLILQPTMCFENVWQKRTNSHSICIGLDRRIYFNNYSEGYLKDGLNGTPLQLYSIPQERRGGGGRRGSNRAVEGAMSYFCHIRQRPTKEEEKEVCLLLLTSDNYLKLINADTGTILRSIYLSGNISFKTLAWAEYLESIQVKSVRYKNENNINSDRYMSLMSFKIHPIKLIAHFHISKQIFGAQINDASLTEDLLLIAVGHCTYQYYSMQWILDNCVTNSSIQLDTPYYSQDSLAYFTPGTYPNSIPTNIHINSRPPLLFETKCNLQVGVQFGGWPLHYIHNSKYLQINEFHLKNLHTEEEIDTFTTNTMAFHQDVVDFHFEDYQQIIHISGCTLRCYRLLPRSKCVQLMYMTDFRETTQQQDESQIQVSSRGRIIKKIAKPEMFNDFVSAVQDVDYENEVNLFYVVITLPEGEETKAFVCFINEKNGQILKKVPIPSWSVEGGNSVYYELDCIIHTVQNKICNFYRLTRQDNQK